MPSRFLSARTTLACIALAGLPAFAQVDIKAVVLKHLKTCAISPLRLRIKCRRQITALSSPLRR